MGHLGCPYLFSINEMLVHVSTSILPLPCPLSLLNTWHRWLALQSLEMFRAQVHALPNCVLSPLLPTTRTSSVKMGEQGDSWKAHQERGARRPVLQDCMRWSPYPSAQHTPTLHPRCGSEVSACGTGFRPVRGLGSDNRSSSNVRGTRSGTVEWKSCGCRWAEGRKRERHLSLKGYISNTCSTWTRSMSLN